MRKLSLRLIGGFGMGIALFLTMDYGDIHYVNMIAVIIAFFSGYLGAKGEVRPAPNSQTGKMTGIV